MPPSMTNKLLGRYYTVINLIAQLMSTSFFKIHYHKFLLEFSIQFDIFLKIWYKIDIESGRAEVPARSLSFYFFKKTLYF